MGKSKSSQVAMWDEMSMAKLFDFAAKDLCQNFSQSKTRRKGLQKQGYNTSNKHREGSSRVKGGPKKNLLRYRAHRQKIGQIVCNRVKKPPYSLFSTIPSGRLIGASSPGKRSRSRAYPASQVLFSCMLARDEPCRSNPPSARL